MAFDSIKRVRILVSGKVQGVGYRHSTHHQAGRLGVRGWVRNLPDSRVEAIFEGKSSAIDAMIDWCHRGSEGAIVKSIEVFSERPEGLTDFKISYL